MSWGPDRTGKRTPEEGKAEEMRLRDRGQKRERALRRSHQERTACRGRRMKQRREKGPRPHGEAAEEPQRTTCRIKDISFCLFGYFPNVYNSK